MSIQSVSKLAPSVFIGPIPWGHSGPLCHALSLSSSLASWTSMRRRRVTVQWRHLVNWREALVVANGPNICQMLLVIFANILKHFNKYAPTFECPLHNY